MRRRILVGIAGAIIMGSLFVRPVQSQLIDVPKTYVGDLWSRPRLTGDWLGVRDELAQHGIWLDVDLVQVLQGVGSGGRDTGVEYGGHVDYRLHVDFQRLGLWPGGFLTLFAESQYGNSVNQKAGASIPVNTAAVFPELDENSTTLSSVVFTQFLAPWVGVYLGKLDITQGDANEFAHDYRTQFMNLGLQYNLVPFRTVPYTPLGAGIMLIPFEGADVSAGVLDPNGTVTESGFEDFFEDGVTVNGEGRVTIKPFGLTGHQTLGFSWSSKEYNSLDQDPRTFLRPLLLSILAERAPISGQPLPEVAQPDIRTTSGSWSIYYNFDQYVWTRPEDPTRGLGVFFRFGVSDGRANPIKYHYNVGIGGKGLIRGRPRDTLGLGWSYVELSDKLIPNLRAFLDLGLEREHAVELYYSVAVTPWLFVTPDLQIVLPASNNVVEPGPQLKEVDTAVIGGLRVFMRF
jgi:porin